MRRLHAYLWWLWPRTYDRLHMLYCRITLRIEYRFSTPAQRRQRLAASWARVMQSGVLPPKLRDEITDALVDVLMEEH